MFLRSIGKKSAFGTILIKYLSNASLNENSWLTYSLLRISKGGIACNSRSISGDKISSNDGDFMVRLKNDPDIFGDSHSLDTLDEGDLREEKHFTEQVPATQKLRTKQYADIIKKYIKERKIKEAIDVLEIKMLKEDRVKPENYIFNLILGACGRVGYSKKAFMLYNDMKKRGLQVTGGTYTALFNACANSPWPQDGLTRARRLRDIMIEKQYTPNDTTYHAMIKAFGRCGDLTTAFSLADEMANNGIKLKSETMNFLLQACISDKEAGFRHSLLVWRKLLEKKIHPGIFTFNLLLRCVRDCELGDVSVAKDVIEKILKDSQSLENKSNLLYGACRNVQLLEPKQAEPGQYSGNLVNLTDLKQSSFETNYEDSSNDNIRPNLLAPVPNLNNLISLTEVRKPEDRLLLLGGFSGFLRTMKIYRCAPNIKTFTELLDSIPGTNAAETELLKSMRLHGVQPDIDFYNMLIKKRSMRFDYVGAREVLELLKKKFKPNVMTYGTLALSCKTKEEALELIDEMKSSKYRLNSAIVGAMLSQACHHWNFPYIFHMMELCLGEGIAVSKKLLQHLEGFKSVGKTLSDKKELSNSQQKWFEIFKTRHKTWLQQVQTDESEDAHPWQQFRQTYPDNVKYKWKDGVKFKAKHTSLFKVKTSLKQRY
ncbi:pentatricopeptide repeat-containing protein 1, mitochondrial [Cylas formicarius]|uniref:pentatricopeptide repeat-containing protein 1, mitochondrial n=1 Tax=Cylas formicarius TaxID=197179 RepID=UPI0029587EC4|nr:pentatricopeptide repeat-containing protein 1, mitochondrial [Cylas formicarius]